MGLTSEQVHWLVGGALCAVSLVVLPYETQLWSARALRFVLPLGILAFGAQAVLDPLLHGSAGPRNYAAETAQHVLQGAFILSVGAVELLRAMGRLRHRGFGFLLPLGMIAVGVIFLLHAQHDAAGPQILLLTQHRVTGATVCLAGLAKALAETGHAKLRPFGVAFLVLVLAVGVQFLLYTEGGTPMGHSGH